MKAESKIHVRAATATMRPLLRTTTRVPLRQTQNSSRSSSLRSFTIAARLRLKEDSDRSPQEVETQKQESLKKDEWNRGTASSSEEVVGADQQKVKDHDKHMDDLQKQTAQKSEEQHPEGKS